MEQQLATKTFAAFVVEPIQTEAGVLIPPPESLIQRSRHGIGMAHSEAFAKACTAGDIPGVLALYADDATVIWPNEGEVAHGKMAPCRRRDATRRCGRAASLFVHPWMVRLVNRLLRVPDGIA